MIHQHTITAIATPKGKGGVALIRISGDDALNIVSKIFVSAKKDFVLSAQQGYSLHYGKVLNGNKELIDDVLVSIFKAPHSYTGEDVVEIACHGSEYIQKEILRLLIDNGCSLAQRGEFTQRAFFNGKMDLTQSEAIADLIDATSSASHKMAMNQMRGGFSAELKDLRQKLLHFVSMIELELDFSEEDVEFANRQALRQLAEQIKDKVSRLADSFRIGNVMKKGIPVALVGETNVGKSTLLNYLLNEDKAIVSDIHGTTRDVIEDTVEIEGIVFRFIDTAGIRQTTDVVENLGIEKTYEKISQSDIVLWLVDCTEVTEHIEWLTEKIFKRAEGKKVIIIFNKIDILDQEETNVINELFSQFDTEKIHISAKKQLNTNALKRALVEASDMKSIDDNDIIVSNVRHYEALVKAREAICRVLAGLEQGISEELLSRDIRECMDYLGSITGELTTDEVLGNIFKNFCIGK